MKKQMILAAALTVALIALAGCGSSSGKAAHDLGTVEMGPGMVYQPNKLAGPAGHLKVTLVNRDSQLHDFAIDGAKVVKQVLAGQTATVEFDLDKPGSYTFYCTQPGHKDSGMTGVIVVK